MKYSIPQNELLSLDKRLENVQHLRVTDLRSIEARIRRAASSQLKEMFPNMIACDSCIKYMAILGNINLSPTTTYGEASKHIYSLFASGRVSEGVQILKIFLPAIWRLNPEKPANDPHKVLQVSEARRLIIFLDDYNLVLDQMFPDCGKNLLRHSNSFNYSSILLAHLAFKELGRLREYEDRIYEDVVISKGYLDWGELEKYSRISTSDSNLDPAQIKESYLLLKEIFIDPYYYLWKEEHENIIFSFL